MRWMPVAALIAFAFFAMQASAQVHRCKDASGKLTYSDQPCASGQNGEIIERQKSREQILEERLQAAEANERKYRSQAAQQEVQMFEQQQRLSVMPPSRQPAAQDKAASRQCKEAQKELEFVSSIRTLSQNEKRMRTNAAITSVNAACGSNTQLMQEPPKVVVQPTHITHCDSAFCYDSRGTALHRTGTDLLTGPNGRTCHRTGSIWNCN